MSNQCKSDRALLCLTTAALRDHLAGFPDDEIVAADGRNGLPALLVQLVTHLRGAGENDEGAWDNDSTQHIRVAPKSADESRPPAEQLWELKARGLSFGDCVNAFGLSSANSRYITAAIDRHGRDGEVEIDEQAVVSAGGDAGAYVMAWVWVDDDDLPETHYAAALEIMLEAVRAEPKEPNPAADDDAATELEAYADWLAELLSNFADEIDNIDAEMATRPTANPLTWVDARGVSWTFMPSQAIRQLLDCVFNSDIDAPAIKKIEEFVDQYGETLNKILGSVQLTPVLGEEDTLPDDTAAADPTFIPMDDIEPDLLAEWRDEVANGDTRLGIDDWVIHNREAEKTITEALASSHC